MRNNYYKEKERSMFTKELSKYDLKNDFQRALFFRECLDGPIYFKHIKGDPEYSESSFNRWLQGKGPSRQSLYLRYEVWDHHRPLSLDELLYKIMVEIPELVKPQAKKYKEEYDEWFRTESQRGWCGQKFEPSEEVREYSYHIFEKFKEHFSTEENILKTLDHLSRIMRVEKKKKEDSDDD
tara:strand:+ start:1623 stop:2165 length:543 start_codon:yes stop_codon:yes gene_type:complete